MESLLHARHCARALHGVTLFHPHMNTMRTSTGRFYRGSQAQRGFCLLTQDHTAGSGWSQESHTSSVTSGTVLRATPLGPPRRCYMKAFAVPWPACLEPMFRRAGRALAKRNRLGVRSLHSTPGGSDLLYGSISLSNMGQKNPCVKSLPLPNVEDFKERKLIWRFYMEKLPINVGLDFQPPS